MYVYMPSNVSRTYIVHRRDAIQDFVASLQIVEVDSFVLSGASKRGWTTWLAAGVDDRIIGFVPIVMPILNMTPNLNNAYRSLGGWSWTFADYVRSPTKYKIE